jgi:GNAT superfamily N-acetyltransferase
MKLTLRKYQNEDDFWRIRAFLRQVFLLNNRRALSWQVARFDYWRWHGVENCGDGRLEDISLWETPEGQIAALVNPEGIGEAHFSIYPDVNTPELAIEMVVTAEQSLAKTNSEGQKTLTAWVNEHQKHLKSALLQRGYVQTEFAESMRYRSLDEPILEAPPAPGYTVRSLGDGLELLERCYASGLAFHEDDIHTARDNRDHPQWYRNIQTAPLYRRDFDIVAVASDGSVASFCTIWFDDVTRSAYFEPVATVPAHQRRGLGKAVMCEGLRRLKRMGCTKAFVGSYSPEAHALYAAVGFTAFEILESWEKNL